MLGFLRGLTTPSQDTEMSSEKIENGVNGTNGKQHDLDFLQFGPSNHMDKPVEATITGKVPDWVSGSLFRNGSGVFKFGDDEWKHLFDGFAVVHRWTIKDGKVTFQASILDSEHYQKCFKANRLIGMGFGSYFPDPCKTMFKKVMSYFVPAPPGASDNTGVNVVEHGDKLFAMTETPVVNEITADGLNVKNRFNIGEQLTIHMGTAHTLKSPDGKYTYYYGTNMNHKQAYNFIRIPVSDNKENPWAGAEVLGRVPSRYKMNISYTHSFGVTENYFVHFEQPMCINLPKMMTLSMRGAGIGEAIVCQEDEPLHIILVDMRTGKKVPYTYYAPHGFVFHFGNCYEENGQVIVDLALFESGEIIKGAYLDSIRQSLNNDKPYSMPEATWARYVLPLDCSNAKPGENLVTLPDSKATAKLREGTTDVIDCTIDPMFDTSLTFELPKVNETLTGLKHRYVYGASALSNQNRRLFKFDCETKEVKQWHVEGAHHQPGECVFVPRPGATEEDDGVILSPVVSGHPDHPSYLIILDGKTFKESGRASVPYGTRLSFTFHGFFTDQDHKLPTRGDVSL